jgi:predicted 3-demethylubiquinone-9 3-methyltransferase (glyoxalase superfamily)
MQKITTFLWFDGQAEEAAEFYVSVFRARREAHGGGGESRVAGVSRYGEAGPGTPGSVMTVTFLLDGVEFTALNGGPDFNFTEAISLSVDCETQAEVDQLWDTLTDGGEEGPCGWLKDRYGLSWQVVPRRLNELLLDPDPERSRRAMEAMLKMRKIDIAELERAADAVAA